MVRPFLRRYLSGLFSVSILFALNIPQPVASQNLVLNPGFDCGEEQCFYTLDALEYQEFVCNWSCPTEGTSDIFSTHLKDSSCYAFMPDNGINKELHQVRIGSQVPRSGGRFAGIYAFGLYEYREYLQGTLESALIPGETYCAEMYVSLASHVGYANNNLGMYFHKDSIWEYNSSILHRDPQVIEKAVIEDSINWVKISGTFQATDAFDHVTIGNFFDNTSTISKVKPFSKGTYGNWSYYFVEDVAVFPFVPKPFAFEGERSICAGEQANIYVDADLDEITWTLLSDTTTVIATGRHLNVAPPSTTTYRVTGKNCRIVVKDTITIEVRSFQQVDLGSDTTICEGESITLETGPGYAKYEWQDHSNYHAFKVDKAGKYSVRVEQENGCASYDEVLVETMHKPEFDLGPDRILCDDPLSLEVDEPAATYTWSTGSLGNQISIGDAGRYWLVAENQCGRTVDSIHVYSVKDIFIPNYLSLNEDGFNEKFEIKGVGDLKAGDLKIFNKWGAEIYSAAQYGSNWPDENSHYPSGVYYYLFSVPGCRNFKGWVHLVGN